MHDRFQEWREACVFEHMWEAGLGKYDELKGLDWEMAKNILHLGDKGYGSDHLIKAMKDYTCKWCEKDIHKGNLYARHSPNKFQEPLKPVCRDCAWWLKVENQP